MLRRNSALHGEADFKPPASEHRADGMKIPTFSRWQVKNPMHSSDGDEQGSSPHPSVGTTCVGTVLRPHKASAPAVSQRGSSHAFYTGDSLFLGNGDT